MKTVELAQAKANLELYTQQIEKLPLIITRNGKPVVALVAVDELDLEVLSRRDNPQFLAIIERSRARHEEEGGISTEEMRRRLGLPEKG